MVSIAMEALGVLVFWIHVTSAAVLVGGTIYARAVTVPELQLLTDEERRDAWAVLIARFRPLVFSAIAGLVVSGLYTFLTHPGHTRLFHMWFGVKLLLAAHVFATSIMAVSAPSDKPGEDTRRIRRLTGVVISGLAVFLVAAFLRRIY